MAEPLAVTTAIITLYSTLVKLKRYRDSFTEAPEIISALLRECDSTFVILQHTKERLQGYRNQRSTSKEIDIRAELQDHIAQFKSEVDALKHELVNLRHHPTTNLDHIKGVVSKKWRVERLLKIHKKIVQSRKQFDGLYACLNGDDIIWLRRHSEQKSILAKRTDASQSFDSGETMSNFWKDSAPTDTEHVISEEGTEILFEAISWGSEEAVDTILHTLHISPNHKGTKMLKFPIHAAIESGNLNIIEALLQSRADPNVRDQYGHTPLHMAARRNMADVIRLLLDKGANPDIENNSGYMPLWIVPWHADKPDAFDLLIQAATDAPNRRCPNPDCDCPTALWVAAAHNSFSGVRKLLNAGADPNIQDKQGSTLLHKANWEIAPSLTPLLINNNADPNIRDRDGKLPLHHAAAAGKFSITNHLLSHMREGAVEERDNEEATALIRASQNGSLALVNRLVTIWNAKVSVTDIRGNSPFYCACANGRLDVAIYLANRHRVNVNAPNKIGYTPLHAAARYGFADVVGRLLDLGADREARSGMAGWKEEQVTPAEVARKAGNEEITRIIERFELL